MSPLLVLDISRLLYAALTAVPSGISRVELAYAEYFAANAPDRIQFAARDVLGRIRLLEAGQATRFLGEMGRFWRSELASSAAGRRIAFRALGLHARILVGSTGIQSRLARQKDRHAVYICASQLHLEKPRTIVDLRDRIALKIMYMVHDVLPLEYPEYFPKGEEQEYRSRLLAAARHADVVVTNSRASAEGFGKAFRAESRLPRIIPVALGVDLDRRPDRAMREVDRPYFVMIGTIEPRKNHLMILQLWRDLSRDLGERAPRLVLIGSRGWENENVVDLLDRSASLKGLVEERERQPDEEVARVLSGARALLMPSFAEGFGLPIVEALALGVPVLCSDIAVFREIAGPVPEFMDPNDGAAWRSAIVDYASPSSPRRAAQLARLERHVPVRWESHFREIVDLLDSMCEPVRA